MSQENVEAFHRGMDAWNRRDLPVWLEGMHPEVELHPSAALVEGSAYRGLEGARKFWADIDTAYEALATTYDEVRDLGEGVLGLGRIRGRSNEGFTVDMEYGVIIRYRDGLAVWARSWFDRDEARQAAGLSE